MSKKSIVVTFGRMNPPHVGHKKLIDEGRRRAYERGADFMAVVTRSYTKGTNPLPPNLKVQLIKEFYRTNAPNLNVRHVQTYGELLGALKANGYNDIMLVVGTNRGSSFGANVRNTIARNNSNISATKVRTQARGAGSFVNFARLYPANFNQQLLRLAYNTIRNTQAPTTPPKSAKKSATSAKKSATSIKHSATSIKKSATKPGRRSTKK